MEHCTTRFFEECDADSDNYIALEEWAACFGVKERECPPQDDTGWTACFLEALTSPSMFVFSEDIDKELVI